MARSYSSYCLGDVVDKFNDALRRTFDDFEDVDGFFSPYHHRSLTDGMDRKIKCLTSSRGFPLKVDLTDEDGSYHLKAELPGFKKEDIDVSIERGNILKISAKSCMEKEIRDGEDSKGGKKGKEKDGDKEKNAKDEEAKNKRSYILKERSSSSIERRITLPADADSDNTEQSFVNGLLEIKFKKSGSDVRKISL